MKEVIIDATGQSPGRIAVNAVRFLLGKDRADWAPNRLSGVSVKVTNAAAMQIPLRRKNTKVYRRHSGAPGGFREESLGKVFAQRPEEVVRRAVYGMLPRNRLRAVALRRLRVLAGSGNE